MILRDYHAENLMWLDARAGVARAGLLDFQDALAGSAAYDLIFMTEDARRDVSVELAEAMTVRYIERRRQDEAAFDAEEFRFAGHIAGGTAEYQDCRHFRPIVEAGRQTTLPAIPSAHCQPIWNATSIILPWAGCVAG
jgi:hypothetical protein